MGEAIDDLAAALAAGGVDPAEVDLAAVQRLLDAVIEAGPEELETYEDMHWGERPDAIIEVDDDRFSGETLVSLGELAYVGYRTRKGGEDAIYHHDFEDPPLLAVDRDRKLTVIGGTYNVNRRGIVG